MKVETKKIDLNSPVSFCGGGGGGGEGGTLGIIGSDMANTHNGNYTDGYPR